MCRENGDKAGQARASASGDARGRSCLRAWPHASSSVLLQYTVEQEEAWQPASENAAQQGHHAGDLGDLFSSHQQQEEHKPQHRPCCPAQAEPGTPGGSCGLQGFDSDRNGSDRNEQAKPAQAAPVGTVKAIEGNPEVGERK